MLPPVGSDIAAATTTGTDAMDATVQTLGDRFAALQAERAASWPPETLQANAAQRRRLVESMATRRVVRVGDPLPDATLRRADGDAVELRTLAAGAPIALAFFRFAGCPACNIALPAYRDTLLPGLSALGVRLVAVSPQVPDRVQEIAVRHSLGYAVLTDPDNTLARRLGLVFEPSPAEQAASLASGSFIGDITGTGTWELPMPAVVLADRDRVVRFADVSPDWLSRTEAAPVLAAAASLAPAREAAGRSMAG